jgi:hypothetical protein
VEGAGSGVTSATEWLPRLVTLTEAGGDWNEYVEQVYAWFYNDFIASQPSFKGRRCVCKRHPQIRGKAATFWHVISEGPVEEDRLLDLRRCERIRWPKPMIERFPERGIVIWPSPRPKDKNRISIALDDFSYVVVLADRSQYLVLWTAYCVAQENRQQKLRREYERYVSGK